MPSRKSVGRRKRSRFGSTTSRSDASSSCVRRGLEIQALDDPVEVAVGCPELGPGETDILRANGTEHHRDARSAELLDGGLHIFDQELDHRSGRVVVVL
jgi:hypothetical protein